MFAGHEASIHIEIAMRCVGVAMYAKRAVNLRVLHLLSSKGEGGHAWAPLLHPPVLNQLLYRHPDGIFFPHTILNC